MADAPGREVGRDDVEYRRRRRRQRGWLRSLRHALRPWVSGPLKRLNLALFPPLFVLYLRFVWATSRIVDHGMHVLTETNQKHDGVVALLWHEEVLTVAKAYPHFGARPHTLASRSNDGDVITRILERCGYVVFRGGSSDRDSRRRVSVTRDMIEHMNAGSRVLYGFTVDGSKGPVYRMKRGGIVIARECGRPIVLVRTWYRRLLRLRTWDRTAFPLPFNTIHCYTTGPFSVPADADTRAGLERFAELLEDELIALAARSYDDTGQPRPAGLRTRAQERVVRAAAQGAGAA